MNEAEDIARVNAVLQRHMNTYGKKTLSADEAADLVYADGLMAPAQGPPDAPGFTFRQFIRDLRDKYGYDTLYLLLGVRQARNEPGGVYIFSRFNAPSLEKITELLSAPPTEMAQTTETGQGGDSLPDYLQPGLDVVFVGTSVGEESAKQAHYYSSPHNKFWDLVNQSGLVSDMIGAENDYLILDENCGLTDLAKKKVSSSDANLESSDFDVEGFVEKLEGVKPRFVAFNGKRAFREVFKKDSKDYGLSEEIIGDSFVFVLPSSSGADTSMTFEKKLHWYKKLKAELTKP